MVVNYLMAWLVVNYFMACHGCQLFNYKTAFITVDHKIDFKNVNIFTKNTGLPVKKDLRLSFQKRIID